MRVQREHELLMHREQQQRFNQHIFHQQQYPRGANMTMGTPGMGLHHQLPPMQPPHPHQQQPLQQQQQQQPSPLTSQQKKGLSLTVCIHMLIMFTS